MGDTPVCVIDATGIVRPSFAACLSYFQSVYRNIYGVDVYLGADCQDGQFIALLANALHDVNGASVAAYNAYSPATAQGEGLSSNVKINGIARKLPTHSTVDLLLVGQVGEEIVDGLVRDTNGVTWALPASVVFPNAGQIVVTATCQTIGAITATANTITAIATPTLGWQSVTNPAAATPGVPVEIDAMLRQRQTISTALPSVTIMEGVLGALAQISGVSRLRGYENDTDIAADNGQPAHTVTFVIDGGDAATIASTIAKKKSPGVGTYGDVLQTVYDAFGIPHPIRFFRPALVPVAYYLKVRALRGYTTDVRDAIQAALAAYTNGLGIGEPLLLRRAYGPALLSGDARNQSYEIVDMVAKRKDTSFDTYGDIEIAFNQALACDPADITFQVVT